MDLLRKWFADTYRIECMTTDATGRQYYFIKAYTSWEAVTVGLQMGQKLQGKHDKNWILVDVRKI